MWNKVDYLEHVDQSINQSFISGLFHSILLPDRHADHVSPDEVDHIGSCLWPTSCALLVRNLIIDLLLWVFMLMLMMWSFCNCHDVLTILLTSAHLNVQVYPVNAVQVPPGGDLLCHRFSRFPENQKQLIKKREMILVGWSLPCCEPFPWIRVDTVSIPAENIFQPWSTTIKVLSGFWLPTLQ